MSPRIDLFTPWRDRPDLLRARHVGRDEELDLLAREARSFLAGRQPLPIYLYGPRGIGKSHLLALLQASLSDEAERVIYVGEDIPESRSATDLLQRIDSVESGPRWRRKEAADRPVRGRRIVLLEGLDRQLQALGSTGRRELRRAFLGDPDRWLVATGVALESTLTDSDEAFFGAFAPWPLGPLDDDDAAGLLDRLVLADGQPADPRWPARRKTLVTLAGGMPRSLMALGLAAQKDPDALAADDLLAAIQGFTSHYQQRYRDQSPDGQKLITLLSEARRELSPSDIAQRLEWSPQKASVLANRMTVGGVLRNRTETDEEKEHARQRGADLRGGSASLFRLGEPLFRYWLEYRNAPWNQTRVGILGGFLEQLLTDEEVVAAWLGNPDDEIERNERVLAWGLTLARLAERDWSDVLQGMRGRPYDDARFNTTTELGLVALGAATPERLRDLGRELDASWKDRVADAEVILDQLREPLRGRLHPELEALRVLLDDGIRPHPRGA